MKMERQKFLFRLVVFYFLAIYFSIALMPLKKQNVNAEKNYEVSKAECVIEESTGRILYEWRGDLRLPMASTTKILTAATVLDICQNLDEEVKIPAEVVGIEGSSVYLKQGDIYTVEELLYGLMLRSGNDCAVALALHCCNSLQDFIAKMNETAQKAGALDSHFSNPHGLPCDNHYTTARDLCNITRYAMKNSLFRKIVATKYYEPRQWKNKNKLLFSYEGAMGVKTGYTKEAGRCLVSAAKREGMGVICVVLHCQPMFERSATLMNDAFSTYSMHRLVYKDEVLNFSDGKKEWQGRITEDYYYPLAKGEEEHVEILATAITQRKMKENVGQFRIYLSKRLLFLGNLYKL